MDIPRLVKRKKRIGQFQVTPIDPNSIHYKPSRKKITITGVKEDTGFTYEDNNGTEQIIPFKNIRGKFNSKNALEYIGQNLIIDFTYKVVRGKMTCTGISATFDDKTQGNDR